MNETLHYYISGVVHDVPKTRNLDGTYTYDNAGKMTSVNYPATYAWNGTQVAPASGPAYTYAFEAMQRPNSLTDQNGLFVVSNVTYNAANQLLTMGNETHTYNSLNQMTHLTITGNLDITYTFPAGTNNGKIGSQKDNLSGETVTYQYDSLNRLLSASSSQAWSETYGFDGFGNLVSKTPTGGAPALSIAVDPATNHIVGQTYDGNGNQTSSPSPVYYDAENRLEFVSLAGVHYRYDSRNKRIWKSTLSGGNLTQEVYFYGVDGQKLGTYTLQLFLSSSNVPDITDTNTGQAIFFGGKRLGTYDRLETAKFNPNGQQQSFYPYGEDRGTVQPNDALKFATYTRDTATGLDYADQRYYANNFGRFMSPDPYAHSGGPAVPGSWNRYPYGLGDPVNNNDPSGLDTCDPLAFDFDPSLCLEDWTFGSLFPGFPGSTVANPNFIIQFTPAEIGSILGAYVGAFPGQLQDVTFGFLENACDCPIKPLSQVDWSAIWADIVTFLKSQQFGRLRSNTYSVTCYVHVIGDPNHGADQSFTVQVLAPDSATALYIAKPLILDMARAAYGPTGWHLQHCNVVKIG